HTVERADEVSCHAFAFALSKVEHRRVGCRVSPEVHVHQELVVEAEHGRVHRDVCASDGAGAGLGYWPRVRGSQAAPGGQLIPDALFFTTQAYCRAVGVTEADADVDAFSNLAGHDLREPGDGVPEP